MFIRDLLHLSTTSFPSDDNVSHVFVPIPALSQLTDEVVENYYQGHCMSLSAIVNKQAISQ